MSFYHSGKQERIYKQRIVSEKSSHRGDRMRIEWLGHACFLLTGRDGLRLVTDPFNEQVGYPVPRTKADIVTVSHDHFDHNATQFIGGSPVIVRGTGDQNVKGISIKGIPTFHDKSQGRERGPNTVYKIALDGITVCHLGDLGHTLTEDQLKTLGRVDVLLLPVGGTYTIDPQEAAEVVRQVNPVVAIPMHYKTRYLNFPIQPVDKFTSFFDNVKHAPYFEATPEKLGAPLQIVVLDLATTS